MMNANAATAALSKNLGDLSKNTAAINNLMLAILRVVEHVGAHKATGREQSVSFYFFCLLLLLYLTQNAPENNQPFRF